MVFIDHITLTRGNKNVYTQLGICVKGNRKDTKDTVRLVTQREMERMERIGHFSDFTCFE